MSFAKDECLIWTGLKAGNGYGVTYISGKTVYMHRVSWSSFHSKEIPKGMVVAHKCDTPACYNPHHLFLCTQKENLADMREKGRGQSGETHWTRKKPALVRKGQKVSTSKLSDSDVIAMRLEYVKGVPGKRGEASLTSLAKKYGVAFQTASKIINRVSWRHI